MNTCSAVIISVICCVLFSCSASLKNYSPQKKYPQEVLKNDYRLLQSILEKKHPSLYWYTSKDSMDAYFAKYYQAIPDSMTEQQFAWHILAPLTDKIHCGHTSVSLSKGYAKWVEGKKFGSFPLFMKIWNDTMAVTANLNRNDSIFKRGTLVTSVNGLPAQTLINTFFDHLPEDGYANNINYIRISGNFPYFHRNIFGLSKEYKVTYLDSLGNTQTATIPAYAPPKDTTRKDSLKRTVKVKPAKQKLPKENRLNQYRTLKIDSSGKYAVMTVNTFSKGRLRTFFRRSFRELKEKNINHLVLDIRSNGGGHVMLSTLLTKYISRKRFRVADSLYAVSGKLGPYTKYIKGKWLNNIELKFIARKKTDGQYHIGHLERKWFNPKKKNHYNGDVYVLTNGPTFSAAALFANAVKGQEGVLLLGEETGGGWHGNDGIMIPEIILPNTKVRIRLPLFRLVQFNHPPKTGTGIIPDVYIGTSYDALKKGYDKKMQVVKEMIMEKENKLLINNY